MLNISVKGKLEDEGLAINASCYKFVYYQLINYRSIILNIQFILS